MLKKSCKKNFPQKPRQTTKYIFAAKLDKSNLKPTMVTPITPPTLKSSTLLKAHKCRQRIPHPTFTKLPQSQFFVERTAKPRKSTRKVFINFREGWKWKCCEVCGCVNFVNMLNASRRFYFCYSAVERPGYGGKRRKSCWMLQILFILSENILLA